MMTQKSLHPPIGRGIIYGAIGGLVGGIVMYAIMSVVMLAINMGANCFAIIVAMITGQPYSNNLIPLGVAVHLITSTVIGAIFGVIITSIRKLKITGFARGIRYGVAAGLIAFVVIFLPITLTVMPSKMMDVMKAMDSQIMPAASSGLISSGGKGPMTPSSSNNMPSSNTGGMAGKVGMSGNTGMGEKSGMMSSNSTSGGMMQGSSNQMNGKSGMMMSGSSTGSSNDAGMSNNNTPSGKTNEMTGKAAMSSNIGMGQKSEMNSGSSSNINGMNNNQMMMTMPDPAKLQSTITQGSLLGHTVFGAVLGAVTTLLIIKTQVRNKEKSKLV